MTYISRKEAHQLLLSFIDLGAEIVYSCPTANAEDVIGYGFQGDAVFIAKKRIYGLFAKAVPYKAHECSAGIALVFDDCNFPA